MSNKELEQLAAKHNIEEYVNASGPISRKAIIDQLLERDKARSKISIIGKYIAIISGVLALALTVLKIWDFMG